MKKHLSFIGILLLLPILTFFSYFTLDKLKINIYIGGFILFYTSCIIISIIFNKQIKINQFYKNIKLLPTIFVAFIISIGLKLMCSTILSYGTNLFEFIAKPKKYNLSYLLAVYLLAPILEELWCRVIIINKFKGIINSVILIIGTAILFGFLHLNDIKSFISFFTFGLVLSYIFFKTENALLIILVHFFFNFIATIIGIYFYKIKYIFAFTAHYFYVSMGVFAIVAILLFGVYRKQFDKWLIKTTKTKEIEN